MSKNLTTTSKPAEVVPQYIWEIVQKLLAGVSISDEKVDLRKPQPNKSLESVASYIIFAYGVLIVYGVLSNILVFIHILQYRLNKDPTYAFILNNAISDILKCVVVLPLSLYVLLIQNWMLGELLCTFLPMIQDIPFHVTMLTYVFLAWDRCRYLRNPTEPRLPAFVCAFGTWLTSLCLVLPYPIYITHFDLGEILKAPELQGVSLCVHNLADDMKEYMRGIFLVTYAGPLAAISYFFVTGSREIPYHSAPAVIFYESQTRTGRARTDSHSTTVGEIRSCRGEYDSRCSDYSQDIYRENGRARYEIREAELDVVKEERTHKYLCSIISIYAICLLPIMVLKVAKLALIETYDNSRSFDYVYIAFVWLAFFPTCTTPAIFAFWQMSSNRRLMQSSETVVTTADTPSSKQKYHRGSHVQLDEREPETNLFFEEKLI
ncbi:orexin/Hypocretin receptor type 1 isoform X2 [Anthonomus grandis grandis]|uniref:orexin/Hypocretin receptor type 1 isoform X2 n=1 Tax=Anthonomus grandis grandis TaxID=2921223 RepID=UPI0021653071|nr:orexin/Hypocretin receptor type 1 isoform X2 [Anthonomus grandis grandis]